MTRHQQPVAPASYTAVLTRLALVKDHFATEQRALEAWIADWTHDPEFQAWARP